MTFPSKMDISVVPINPLVRALTTYTSNFVDQSQFLKTNSFSEYLHMIKRHTFFFPIYV